jgi:hypothetical protein
MSNSMLMNWDVDYPINKFKPPKDYKLEAVDTNKNRVVEREQIQDCEYLSNLIASFEEEYVWLEVESDLLIWKQKEGAGFQDWHIDLAKKWPNSRHNLCQYWIIRHSGRFWRNQLSKLKR